MNTVRERILIDIGGSLREYPWSEHRDLASFCVCGECFEDWRDKEYDIKRDFDEVLAIVDKDWLYAQMIKEGIENPRDYLINEYTSEDSSMWFDEAANNNHLATIIFN